MIHSAVITVKRRCNRGTKSRARGASMAEFGPVLVLLILITIVPLAGLLSFAAGYVCITTTCQSCAADAANAASFDEALAAVKKRALAAAQLPLGKFGRIKAAAGYQACGMDLYLATTSMANTNSGHFYGPNTGLPQGQNVDSAKEMYEYTVRSSFTVGPLIDMSNLPIIGQMPFLGQPTAIDVSASRAAEHTDALTAESTCQSGVRH